VVGRQFRCTGVKEIAKLKGALKACIYEAIEAEKAGLKVDVGERSTVGVAAEFQDKLDKQPALKKAFHALTPGRQRAYHLYFTQPKQAKTRESRVEKCLKQILAGRGLND
jgi:uncharacterized protein YdeI (YjbR/CyaY-like superfamily)